MPDLPTGSVAGRVTRFIPYSKIMTSYSDQARINRYRSQSIRLLNAAMTELQGGKWTRSEELLWGSLTLAVKGAALSRGNNVEDDPAVKAYAQALGSELRDRRVREAFEQLASLTDSLERSRETRRRVDRVYRVLEDIGGAIERLWDLVDTNLAAQDDKG